MESEDNCDGEEGKNVVEFKLKNVPLNKKKERIFPVLELNRCDSASEMNRIAPQDQPLLVVQSPKTPTLSKKLKAVSLDSDQKDESLLRVSRDVFSMPNTPKKQTKLKFCSRDEEGNDRFVCPMSHGSSNLKKFASNSSISGSQTLKTLPEIMTLQDFSDSKAEPVRIKAKGLLERRGSNASLTIDLGSSSNILESKPIFRLNTAKSVSNLNLSTFGSEKCWCLPKGAPLDKRPSIDRRKSQTLLECCDKCTIYEFIPTKNNGCKANVHSKRCSCFCNSKCRRKSLSNENLYIPPCNFCQKNNKTIDISKNHKGFRRTCYPRQADLEASQLLSEDFKLHLQNVQYLQTAGSVLSIADLKISCEGSRVPKLHQEFWEVPLNLQEKCLVSGSQSRNRYRGVLPNEHSRVHLPSSQSYIHANYIKGPDYTETAYIATQGPMAHTCVDFWEMIWANKSFCVVMLTGLIEKGKNKCELYFPLGKRTHVEKSYLSIRTNRLKDKFTFDSKNTKEYEEETVRFEEVNEVQYGDYRIKYLRESFLGECCLRELELEKISENSTRSIKHFWYPNWQDHKMCNPEQILQIALHILDLIDNKKKKGFDIKKMQEGGKSKESKAGVPIVVHCSAGIGRTGCFLAILNGIQQLKSNYNVDVLAILCSLRLHRGGMVQTAEQYELIHRVLSLYADNIH